MQDCGESAGTVDIWTADLDLSASHLSDLSRLLSADEIARAERFRFERDRHRYIAARGALRTLLGRYLGQDPVVLRFSYGSHGKPTLAGAENGRSLYFNVSHSGGRALYAVTELGEVGIDLEYMRADIPVEEVATRFFTAAETALLLQAESGPERRTRFYTYWTRKEAYCKAIGIGLSFDPHRVDVAEPRNAQRETFALYIDGHVDPSFALCDLEPGDDYAGAVAVAGNRCSVTVRELNMD